MARAVKPWSELNEEQRKNRLKNDRQKKKRMNNNVTVIGLPSKVVNESVGSVSKINKWNSLGIFLVDPASVFQVLSVCGIVSYLLYQFHMYDSLITGLIVEFLAIVYAVLYSNSDDRLTKMLSGAAILGTIYFSAFVLHSGMDVESRFSDEGLNSLREQRSIVVSQISSIQGSHDSLPSTYLTKKSKLRSEINILSSQLSNLDSKISMSPVVSSNNYASIIIRILAMLASMSIIHVFVRRLNESIKT